MKSFYQVFIPLVLLSDFVHTFSFLFSSPPYSSSLFQFLLILYHVCICTAHARGCTHTHTDGKRKKTDKVFHQIMHAINYIHNKFDKKKNYIHNKSPANLSSTRVCFGLWTSVCIHRHTHTHTHTHVCKYICSYHFHIHVTWFLDLLYSAHSKKSNIRPLLCSMNEVRHTNTIHMT
jgi:hypothetical protein